MDQLQFLEKIKTKFGNRLTIVTPYEKTHKEIIVIDNEHPEKGQIRITPNHLLTRGLPKYNRIRSTEELKERIQFLVANEYTVLSDYINGKTKVKFIHNSCGHIFEMRPEDFLAGQRCPKCANIKRADSKRKSYNAVIEEVSSLPDNYELISSEYHDNKSNIEVLHKDCGNIWKTSLVNLRRHGCPHCALKSVSKKEKELTEFIKSFYLGNIEENKRFRIDEKEYEGDIVINDLKIIIEFDGLYWHSTKVLSDPNYHINKTKAFKSIGYRVIHVFENEWETKKNIVKEKIKHILGYNCEKVYARKTNTKEISSKEACTFLETYHLQGSTPATYNIGLFSNNELVAVMTFGFDRFNKNKNGVELIRYATSKNVIGGFSKLLKYAIDKYNFKNITTYADLRWSSFDNNLYKKNGFILDHQSAPGYAYYDPYTFEKLNRYTFRKSELKKKFPEIFDEKLSETEIINKTKYLKVYDCGNLVYKIKR